MTSDKKLSDSMRAALDACPLYRWQGGFWFPEPPPDPRSLLLDHHLTARFGRHAHWEGPVYWGTPTTTALIDRGLVAVTRFGENLGGRFPIAVDDVRRVGAEGDHDGGEGQPPSQGDPGGEPPCRAGLDGKHAIAGVNLTPGRFPSECAICGAATSAGLGLRMYEGEVVGDGASDWAVRAVCDGCYAMHAGSAAPPAAVLPELLQFPLKMFGGFRLLMPVRLVPPRYNRGPDGSER